MVMGLLYHANIFKCMGNDMEYIQFFPMRNVIDYYIAMILHFDGFKTFFTAKLMRPEF